MTEKVKNWLSKPSALNRAAILLMITMTLSNVLGLVRNVILSKNISLDRLDAYYTAFNIPDLVFNLMVLGAISTALIPVFSQLLKDKDEEKAWRVVNNFLNTTVLFLLIFLVIAFIFMDPLITILAPGFGEEKHILTVSMARIMLLSPLLFAISYIIGGVLNTYKNFVAYAIAPLVYNLSIIIGALLAPKLHGVETVAISVVIGALAHLLVQLPAALSIGWRHKMIIDFKDEYLRKIYRLMIPRSIGLGITQINFIAFTIIGSTMDKGAIAIYKLTNDLQTTPTVIFGSSIAIAAFPFMTEKASQNDRAGVADIAHKATRIILFLLLPCAAFALILSNKIIPLYLALGHNMVNWADTMRAIDTFSLLVISIISQGLIGVYARVYYAFSDTRRPMYYSFVSAVVSVIFALIFKYLNWDVKGLALAFTIGSWLNFALLYINSKKYFKVKESTAVANSFFKILFSTLISGSMAYVVLRFSEIFITSTKVFGLVGQALITLLIGVIIYWYILYLLDAKELQWIKNRKQTFTEK